MRTTSTASGRSGSAVPGRRDRRPVPRRRPDAPHRRPAPRTGGAWRGPLAPAAWPSLTGRQRLTYLAVLLAGTIWLMVPRLYGAFTAHVHKEDGEIFLHGSLTGASLLERYTGYLHVVPRLISNACAQGSAEAYPVCVASASASLRLLLALLVIVVVTPCTRAWWAPLACGALALFGGVGQQEVLGNLTNLRWFLVVGTTFALLGALRRPGHVLLGVLFVTGAALTDPLAFALAPVALWRLAALSGRQRLVPAAMLLALVLHGALIDTAARSSSLLDSRGDEWATRGPSWPDTLTQARRTCQEEGVTTVTVPLTPQGVPTPWTAVLTCRWVQGHQDAAGSAAPGPGQYPTHS